MNIIDDFMKYVYPEPNTGCWLWASAVNYRGYGKVGQKYSGGFNLAHRYSYYLFNGSFDIKMHVLHKCDNPACVNPDHLFLGSQADNVKDMLSKNRGAIGQKIGRSRFTNEEIITIRNLYKEGINTVGELASIYNVGNPAISKIVHRKNWKHI